SPSFRRRGREPLPAHAYRLARGGQARSQDRRSHADHRGRVRPTSGHRCRSEPGACHCARALPARRRSRRSCGGPAPMNEAQFRDPGEVPVLDWVDKSLIDVDPAYQRRPDEGRVARILDWFEWSSFGAIVVAPSGDGRFHVTDGQHRLEAARRHPAITVVPAVIIPKSGTTEEAGNFVVLNVERRNISQLDRYWAELAAEDP